MKNILAEELIDGWIKEIIALNEYWETMAQTGLILTVLVGLLGIFLATANNFTNYSCKKISTMIGLSIGIITVILNTVFHNDYRIYEKLKIKN